MGGVELPSATRYLPDTLGLRDLADGEGGAQSCSGSRTFLPREDSFFEKFEAHARLLVKAAEALRDLLNGGEGIAAATAAIIAHEEAADEVTRSVFLSIRRTFITPFDRADIRELTTSLDDAIDQMQKTAKSISLFEVTSFQEEMRELADLAIQASLSRARGYPSFLRDLPRNATAPPQRHQRGGDADRKPL